MFQRLLLGIVAVALMQGCAHTAELKKGQSYMHEKQYSQAMQVLTPLAEKGNSNAQYAVGYMYYYGKGVEQDRTKALEWVGKAADQGHEDALEAMKMMKKPSDLAGIDATANAQATTNLTQADPQKEVDSEKSSDTKKDSDVQKDEDPPSNPAPKKVAKKPAPPSAETLER